MSTLSLEELLKAVEKAEEKKEQVPVHKDLFHMDRFINDMEIKVGTSRIPNYIIYYTYMKVWDGVQKEQKKASKIKFFRSLNKRFVSVRTGKLRSYLLNESAFDLSMEGRKKAKHYDEKYNEKIKKKSSKKPKSKKKLQPKS